MGRLPFITILLSSVFALSCMKADCGDVSGSGTLVVSGYVYEKASQTPLSGVNVSLKAFSDFDGNTAVAAVSSTSGADGSYFLFIEDASPRWFYQLRADDPSEKYATEVIQSIEWDGSDRPISLQNFWLEEMID